MKNRNILIIIFTLLCSVNAFPQFIQGWGVYGAETTSRDRYHNGYPLDFQSDPTFLHSKPPSHKGTEYESWAAGGFLDLLNNDRWQWRTEAEYCHKGSNENVLLDPITNAQAKMTNTFTYIQWNNYLKRYTDLGLRKRTYFLVGVRGEYNLSRSTPAYSYIAGNFHKFAVSADAGVGIEFPLKGGWVLFVEEHYNPDAWFQYNSGKVWAMNRTWETRIGIMFRVKKGIGAYDLDCNAPRYHGR